MKRAAIHGMKRGLVCGISFVVTLYAMPYAVRLGMWLGTLLAE